MKEYIIKRLIAALPVLGLVSVITFSILYLAPGDPVEMLLGDEATKEDADRIRHKLGLDRPPHIQFFTWMSNILRGDFGNSVFTGQPVLQAITERLEPTLCLAFISESLAILIALPLGILAAWKANSYIDRLAMVFAVLGFSIPAFWLGINLIFFFSVKIRLLPVMGYVPLKEGLAPFLKHLILPALTLAYTRAALIARMTRASMLEILSEDYIRTARAKGLVERQVLLSHALKNCGIPIVTIIGISIAHLVVGVVIVETVFAIPGVGRLIVEAVLHRDYPIIQASMLMVGSSYVIINLLVDLVYCYFDPRIKY